MTVRQLSDAHVGTTRSELRQQRSFSRRIIGRLAGTWKVAPRHATCWTRVPWAKLCDRSRRRLLAHRWLYTVADRRYRRLYTVPAVGHLAMWLCIHAKEGAWNSNTGNGYLGGLQMTPGWGGVARPDLLSPAAQMALAERQYAATGYSLSWLRGQWPNTSYGCV